MIEPTTITITVSATMAPIIRDAARLDRERLLMALAMLRLWTEGEG